MVDATYSNTAEGGTNGTTVTTANSGGASGTAPAPGAVQVRGPLVMVDGVLR